MPTRRASAPHLIFNIESPEVGLAGEGGMEGVLVALEVVVDDQVVEGVVQARD